eukprot:CAMPEP_0114689184 /NCGR_PEP_ID=MMETSP0191-20121206/64233_1 /TAXON_ID=126664 /ORGANISM="Sorites sp." /LENGTH=96 /DNA_ID=CAMNT_0001977431 /DNA_START=305 /DNA_END=592 /DNA_ORIENTATION=-
MAGQISDEYNDGYNEIMKLKEQEEIQAILENENDSNDDDCDDSQNDSDINIDDDIQNMQDWNIEYNNNDIELPSDIEKAIYYALKTDIDPNENGSS